MRERGLSLVEVLVAGGLLLVLLTLVLRTLHPAAVGTSRGSLRVESQQQAALLLDRLALDLQRSTHSSLSLLPGDPAGIAMQHLIGVSSTGLRQWEQRLHVYHWRSSTREVVLETWPPGPPMLSLGLSRDFGTRLTSSELAALAATRNGTERRLAIGVTGFDLSVPPSREPFELALRLERKVPGSRHPERFQLRRAFTLRN